MFASPQLNVTRLAQLKPGDLFLYDHDARLTVGFAVVGEGSGSNELLPLGLYCSGKLEGLHAQYDRGLSVISFGDGWVFDLPHEAGAWTFDVEHEPVIMAGTDVYFRAVFGQGPHRSATCYIHPRTGDVFYDDRRHFAKPPGMIAAPLRWRIVVKDDPERTIMTYGMGD